jgi:hypothetical protein
MEAAAFRDAAAFSFPVFPHIASPLRTYSVLYSEYVAGD